MYTRLREPPLTAGGDVSIVGIISLTAVSGTAIGLASIVTQLFAAQTGAITFQIGGMGGMNLTGMMLLPAPAGLIIARHGAEVVYALASLSSQFLNALMPGATARWAFVAIRLCVDTCIPIRTVLMTSAFIGQLHRIDQVNAGSDRAFFSGGMAVAGAALKTALTANFSFLVCYCVIAASLAFMSAFSRSFFPEREQVAPGVAADCGAVLQLAALLKNITVSENCSIEFLSGATDAIYSTFIHLVAGSVPCLILRGMLLATGSAMVHIVNMVLLSQIPGEKSKASGLYQLSSMLGAATGALSGGLLSQAFGLNHLFASWVPILLLCAVPIWLIARRTDPHALTAFTPQGGTHGS